LQLSEHTTEAAKLNMALQLASVTPIEKSSILQWARELALIKRDIPDADRRNRLEQLWNAVRKAMNDQNAEILEIRRIAALGSFTLPPRPVTTDSVTEAREALGQALEEAAAEVGATSLVVGRLKNVSPAWAQSLIDRNYRRPPRTTALGCWITNNAPAHPNGYVKVNLRNTYYGESKLEIQPFLHQLSVVAKGRGSQLPVTANGEYEISHLCHNGGCFNPEHLVIEPSALNKARNSCKGSHIICVEGVIEVNPCPHWDDRVWYGGRDGPRRCCVLPALKLTEEHLYKHVHVGREGRIKVR
jgi:Zinc-binding loop region of homing endonuclease